jgi:putative thioredoxin
MNAASDGSTETVARFAIDVPDADFERAVLERSRALPVVVDFWAPWCAPCRTLGPILERVAAQHEGAFVLAKVNVDEAQRVASGLAVRSIPSVIAFRDGHIVREFVGAKPEAFVRQFIEAVLPTEADTLAADGDRLASEGDSAEAEARFRAALGQQPRHARAALGLARLLAARGATDEAADWVERAVLGSALGAEGERLAAEIRTRSTASPSASAASDYEQVAAEAAARPDDGAAQLAFARWLAGAQRHEEALTAYLSSIRLDPKLDDEAARRGMLDLFAVLGSEHDLTQRFRREMARALYR